VRSYRTLSPLPRAEGRGGLLSVALSRGRPRRTLSGTLPCAARTFLGGNNADAITRITPWRILHDLAEVDILGRVHANLVVGVAASNEATRRCAQFIWSHQTSPLAPRLASFEAATYQELAIFPSCCVILFLGATSMRRPQSLAKSENGRIAVIKISVNTL